MLGLLLEIVSKVPGFDTALEVLDRAGNLEEERRKRELEAEVARQLEEQASNPLRRGPRRFDGRAEPKTTASCQKGPASCQ
jgi:hypothetical protein